MTQTLTVINFSADYALTGNKLEGYAHIFGQRANLGHQYEEIRAGAFDKALASKKTDVRAFWNHNRDLVLGRQSAGTLRVSADSKGLAYSLDLPNTTYANDLRELVERKDVNEMSFGFIPNLVGWSKAKDGLMVRSHESVGELVDISPVSIPAFGGTSINLRAQGIETESVRSQLIRLRHRHTK
jgi:HK97 family phage prohead protease